MSTNIQSGSENKIHTLVRRDVNRLLLFYLLKGATAFGVINILALAGMFYTVHQTAREAATVEANQYVELHLKNYIDDSAADVSKSVDSLHKKLLDFMEQYAAVLATKDKIEFLLGTLNDRMTGVDTQKKLLDLRFTQINQSLDNIDVAKISAVSEAIKQLKSENGSVNPLLLQTVQESLNDVKSREAILEKSLADFSPRMDSLAATLAHTVGDIRNDVQQQILVSVTKQIAAIQASAPVIQVGSKGAGKGEADYDLDSTDGQKPRTVRRHVALTGFDKKPDVQVALKTLGISPGISPSNINADVSVDPNSISKEGFDIIFYRGGGGSAPVIQLQAVWIATQN